MVRRKAGRRKAVHRKAVQRVLVVAAHPDGESLCMSLAHATVRGLQRGGKEVDLVDLYADGFQAAMSRAEREAYESREPLIGPDVARYVSLLRNADALIFVYPTWNMGMPAMLKGWVERVLLPGVAFQLNEATGRVDGSLGHLRYMIGITTYGSPRWVSVLTSDMGRRLVRRCMRLMAPSIKTRTKWFGLYGLNRPDPAAITLFLGRVEQAMERL